MAVLSFAKRFWKSSQGFQPTQGRTPAVTPSVLSWPQPPHAHLPKAPGHPLQVSPSPSPPRPQRLPGASYTPSELAAQASEPAPDQGELHSHPGKERQRVGWLVRPDSRAVLRTPVQPCKGGGPYYPRLQIRKQDPGRGRGLPQSHSQCVVGLGPGTRASVFPCVVGSGQE